MLTEVTKLRQRRTFLIVFLERFSSLLNCTTKWIHGPMPSSLAVTSENWFWSGATSPRNDFRVSRERQRSSLEIRLVTSFVSFIERDKNMFRQPRKNKFRSPSVQTQTRLSFSNVTLWYKLLLLQELCHITWHDTVSINLMLARNALADRLKRSPSRDWEL